MAIHLHAYIDLDNMYLKYVKEEIISSFVLIKVPSKSNKTVFILIALVLSPS